MLYPSDITIYSSSIMYRTFKTGAVYGLLPLACFPTHNPDRVGSQELAFFLQKIWYPPSDSNREITPFERVAYTNSARRVVFQ